MMMMMKNLSVQQAEDGTVEVEGFLNISWGVQRPIRLKIQDDKQMLPFIPPAPPDPVSPVSPISPVSLLEDKRFCFAVTVS